MRIDIDPYDARDRLIQYHVDHVMSLDELRMYVVEDLFSTIKNCHETMEHLLDRTGISPEDQACIRKHYELEEKSDES
jgi:hypothetical protein